MQTYKTFVRGTVRCPLCRMEITAELNGDELDNLKKKLADTKLQYDTAKGNYITACEENTKLKRMLAVCEREKGELEAVNELEKRTLEAANERQKNILENTILSLRTKITMQFIGRELDDLKKKLEDTELQRDTAYKFINAMYNDISTAYDQMLNAEQDRDIAEGNYKKAYEENMKLEIMLAVCEREKVNDSAANERERKILLNDIRERDSTTRDLRIEINKLRKINVRNNNDWDWCHLRSEYKAAEAELKETNIALNTHKKAAARAVAWNKQVVGTLVAVIAVLLVVVMAR